MTDYDLIGRQACIIYKLEQRIKDYKKSIDNISGAVYGIGGPLNDNCLAFNKEQRDFLHRLMGYLDFSEGA